MQVFESLLLLLLAAMLLSGIARRLATPYPILLAVGGAVIAFIPNAPSLDVAPELILALFVAPVLLDAAYDTSLRDLRRNWLAVASLSLVAVVATAVVVAIGARALLPEMPWGAAIALGALVAPPDAVAALAVLRQMNPPQRIRAVLEGESLLNDASSLLMYRLAVSAVAAGSFNAATVAPAFGLMVFGSVSVGWLLAKAVGLIASRIDDAPTTVLFQFVTTFGVWIAAERLHLSGVVTIVVFGLTLARASTTALPARLRVSSFATWETATFVLNVLAFTLVGLQLGPILEALAPPERLRYFGFALIILLMVIAVRLGWVTLHHALAAVIRRRTPARGTPTLKEAVVVGWSGMRGVVTLAAALGLPQTFPYRDFILLAAFVVVLGTLLLQGLTLGPLLRLMKFGEDTALSTELQLARKSALQAALEDLSGHGGLAADRLRAEVEVALAGARVGQARADTPDNRLRRQMVTASRQALEALRSSGAIGDVAFRRTEEELDWFELSAQGGDAERR